MVGTFLSIQHRLNPLHLYCRLVDRGWNRGFSATACRSYEILVFFWINQALRTGIFLCCLRHRDFRVLAAPRRR